MNEIKDDQLWRQAKKRAEFKKSLYSYIVVNLFLWLIWWFTDGVRDNHHNGVPWPVWVMLGWGLSLAKQYYDAYHGNREDMTQQEYERLKREREKV